MVIDFSKLNRTELEDFIKEKSMNISAAQDLMDFCFYSGNSLDKIRNLPDFLNLNLNDDEERYYYESRIKPAIKQIESSDYDNNYYRKNIVPKPFKGDGYQLTYLRFKPYQCFPYDDIDIDKDFVETSKIGYFDKEFSYLAVLKDDVVWMSTDPNEINTMKQPILEAKGHVLAFGLGLGYFPLMTALKEEVNDVTIIEKDPKIISIFKKHILPLFEKKEKIHVIEGDAFEYAMRVDKKYNYIFVDIWHNPEDGLPMYLKLYPLLEKTSAKVVYWLEKSILAMYRRCLMTIFEEALLGYTEKNYKKSENEYDDIINGLFYKFSDTGFKSVHDIKQILQDNNLKKLI